MMLTDGFIILALMHNTIYDTAGTNLNQDGQWAFLTASPHTWTDGTRHTYILIGRKCKEIYHKKTNKLNSRPVLTPKQTESHNSNP